MTDDNDFDPGQTLADTQKLGAGVEPSATSSHVGVAAHNGPAAGGKPSRAGAIHPPTPKGAPPRSGRTIYDLIAENCERFPNSDESAVARRVIADGHITPADLVFPLVYGAVCNHRRGMGRSAEVSAIRAVRSAETSAVKNRGGRPVRVIRRDTPADDLAIFVSLLNRWYRVDGERVMLGDMTVGQHKARVGMLNAHVAGTERSRDLHLLAISACESRGVESLRPLFAKKKKGDAA